MPQSDGWINIDIIEPCDQIADLRERWPWEDSSVDEIRAWDIFEHLPSIVHTMNEAHRVLKRGGQIDLFVPTTDGRGAFQDPQHCSWWNCNTLLYFCEQFAEWQRFHVGQGITANFGILRRGYEGWPIEQMDWLDDDGDPRHWLLSKSPIHILFPDNVWKLKVILEAIKS